MKPEFEEDMAEYTLKDWLKGMVADFDISDESLKAVMFNNGADMATEMTDVDERTKDLCLADIYMSLATSSSKTGSVYDSDGGWQKGRATKNVVDRGWFRDQANRLYKKWGSNKASDYGRLTMKNLF